MAQTSKSRRHVVLTFGNFELDEARFELRHSGEPVPIQARAFDTLVHLVKNRHRVVTTAELLKGPWRDSSVNNGSIHQAILLVRRALAKGGNTNREYVETVRGRGFRFVAQVTLAAQQTSLDQKSAS